MKNQKKNCCIYRCKIIVNDKNAYSLYLDMFIYIITLVKHHRHCLLISPSCYQSLKPSQQYPHNFLFHSSKNHHTNTNSVSWFYVQLCQLADFMFSYIFHYSASGSRDTLLLSAYLGVTHGVVSVIVGLVIGVGEGVCAIITKKSLFC